MEDKFIIKRKFGLKELIFNVEVLHQSEQVIRFRVGWSEYTMTIEKRLTERQPWKVTSYNFAISQPDNLQIIFQALEDKINPPEPYKPAWSDHPKNAK